MPDDCPRCTGPVDGDECSRCGWRNRFAASRSSAPTEEFELTPALPRRPKTPEERAALREEHRRGIAKCKEALRAAAARSMRHPTAIPHLLAGGAPAIGKLAERALRGVDRSDEAERERRELEAGLKK